MAAIPSTHMRCSSSMRWRGFLHVRQTGARQPVYLSRVHCGGRAAFFRLAEVVQCLVPSRPGPLSLSSTGQKALPLVLTQTLPRARASHRAELDGGEGNSSSLPGKVLLGPHPALRHRTSLGSVCNLFELMHKQTQNTFN